MSHALAGKLVVGLEGTWPTAAEGQWLAAWRPAGVILFSHNVKSHNQLRDLCKVLHENFPGLEIVADHEGGPVSQLAAAVGRPPACWSLGVIDDAGLTAGVFNETGRRLKAVGLDRVLAPVADVMTESANPVIGCRAFGAETSLVARHTVAAVSGLLSSGLDVCLKHWPGHGGTAVDTHRDGAVAGTGAIPAPFVAGLEAGADAVMVGHLDTEAVGGSPTGQPATLDDGFLTRTRRQFAGCRTGVPVLFADDVSMGALGPAMAARGIPVPAALDSGMFAPAELPLAWFSAFAAAGCDRILVRSLPLRAFPVPAEQVSPPLSLPPASVSDALPEPAAYRDARARLQLRSVADFFDRTQDLCWLDYTPGDRWQVAGGASDACQEEFRRELQRRFRSVTRNPGDGPVPASCTRLLVTSHRPQPAARVADLSLAGSGFCLVMGHPDLEPRFRGLLAPRWRIGALYDVHGPDLFPQEDPGTNI